MDLSHRAQVGDDPNFHRGIAVYMSDFALGHTMMMPHTDHQVKMMASLDHTMWFHAPFKADEWMLYEIDSPWAGSGRGLTLGR